MTRIIAAFSALLAVVALGASRRGDSNAPGLPTSEYASGNVLLAAGDIGDCSGNSVRGTAHLLDSIPGAILTLGDNVYDHGTDGDYRRCYAPTWGRFRSRTHPVPGNHEYEQRDAAPYFRYFGAAAGPIGKGYYQFEMAGWNIIALNSNIDATWRSPQVDWLRNALASANRKCTLAFWHHPRFSSGRHGDSWHVRSLWRALYDARADIVLAGHDHVYERLSRLDPDGNRDSTHGIRSFVVGTGGASLYEFRRFTRNGSEFRYNVRHGILKLTLYAGSYRWEFINTSGKVVDQGADRCR